MEMAARRRKSARRAHHADREHWHRKQDHSTPIPSGGPDTGYLQRQAVADKFDRRTMLISVSPRTYYVFPGGGEGILSSSSDAVLVNTTLV